MIDRYSRKEIADIWELENKFRIWLDIEIAVCEAQAELGVIPNDALAVIKEKANFDLKRIEQIESEVHHDVIAFLTSVSEFVGEDSRYIHFGMTSSDIGDTALCMQLKQAGEIILAGLDRLINVLAVKAVEYKYTPCMGRSHGVHAEPTTFGMKMLLAMEEFKRNKERLIRAVDNISFCKLSGAVGTFSNINPAVEEKVAVRLSLKADPVSTQIIQRDRHAEYMSVLGIIASSLDRLAVEIRHLQRTEVREAEEPFQKGQKGSSAMPHKRNPILCERISGISRVIKTNVMAAFDNVTLWHERDISHSSAERIILPDSTVSLDYILDKMIFVIENLHVYPESMINNINLTGGLFFSQTILLALTAKGLTREQAYTLVQDLAMRVWNREGSLKELASYSDDVKNLLTTDEIEEIFSMDKYYKYIDYIFKKTGLG